MRAVTVGRPSDVKRSSPGIAPGETVVTVWSASSGSGLKVEIASMFRADRWQGGGGSQ